MAIDRGTVWDRLPLRYKGALIVGAPVVALLLTALTSFWFDRRNDRMDALADRARGAQVHIDHLGHEVNEVASALQRYTLTEDADALPQIGSRFLSHVRELGEQRNPETGETYAGAAQSSATLRELILRAELLGREMAQAGEPSERAEDSLDYLVERIFVQAEELSVPEAQADRVAEGIEARLGVLKSQERTADAVTILVGLFGGVLAAGFFARNFTARIAGLGAATERLAAGDAAGDFPNGSDEIGVLGKRVHGAFADLRESEERSRLILETLADGYSALDASWNLTAWNKSAERMLGWSKDEVIGRNLLDVVVPEELRAGHVEDLTAFFESGESAYINKRVETGALHKDGHLVPIDLSVIPIPGRDGLTFHAFVRDLTEPKKAQEDAARRAEHMAGIIQTMSRMASAGMDVQRLHELLLERAVALTGADGAALQLEHAGKLKVVAGVGPAAAHVGRDLDVERSLAGRALQSGRVFVTDDVFAEPDVDLSFSRAVGTRSAICIPLSDAGRVVGVLAVHSTRVDGFAEAEVTDLEILGGFFGAIISKVQAWVAREVVVRERTEALEELRALHDELAAKNEALLLATDEANAANQAKSEFLSRMSHELRTPLNAILGFAQLLGAEPLDEDQADSVCHIEKAGRHLLGLINEVLEIARIESGKTSVTMERVSATSAVSESLDLIKPLAAERGISIVVEEPDALYDVWADPQRVKQILLNLLSNAVKYNHAEGMVAVTFAADDDTLRISVRDTGPGIPAEKVRSLFTPFDRLGAEHSAVEGTGLGLAVSKQLAEAMGASLTLTTADGSGSTFTLQLARSEPGLPQPPHGIPPASSGAPARDHRCAVVYVEDNESNARLVQRALAARPGVRLDVAATAAEGLERAAALRPDLVLLDMNLPDADGLEVLKALKATAAGTPVVVVSAAATSDQRTAALAAGADSYLTKPLDLRELLAVVDRVAEVREGAAV
ncbi:MAG TPA: ATP-binding protein [Actinomycetota bacterium]|nr:ATP-binding protein [Actinomycetota bacterium]